MSFFPVAAEQVIKEIGLHASFQQILNKLQCEDSLILKKSLADVELYMISVARIHQPNVH